MAGTLLSRGGRNCVPTRIQSMQTGHRERPLSANCPSFTFLGGAVSPAWRPAQVGALGAAAMGEACEADEQEQEDADEDDGYP